MLDVGRTPGTVVGTLWPFQVLEPVLPPSPFPRTLGSGQGWFAFSLYSGFPSRCVDVVTPGQPCGVAFVPFCGPLIVTALKAS